VTKLAFLAVFITVCPNDRSVSGQL